MERRVAVGGVGESSGAERSLLLAVIHVGLLVAVLGAVFGRDVFRLGGQSVGYGVDLLLQGVRGLLFLFGRYLVYPLAVAVWLLTEVRSGAAGFGQRLIGARRFGLLLAYLAASAFLSPFPEATCTKAELFCAYVLPALFAMWALGLPAGTLWLRQGIMVFGAINLAVLGASGEGVNVVHGGLPAEDSDQGERLIVESDTIATAVNFYMYALAGMLTGLDRRARSMWRLMGMCVFPLSAILGLFTGSRGPLVAFVLSVVLCLAIRYQGRSAKLLVCILATGVMLFAGRLLPWAAPGAYDRLSGSVASVLPGLSQESYAPEKLQADERWDFYLAVLETEPTLFGHGLGSFGEHAHRPNEYVHNLFLEAYFETGIVGLLLTCWVVFGGFCSILCAYRSTGHDGLLFSVVALTFYFIESQFSGTLLGNKGLLPFLLLAYCASTGLLVPGWCRRLLGVSHAFPQNLHTVSRVS